MTKLGQFLSSWWGGWKRRKTVAGEEYVNGQPVPPPDQQ